MLQRNPIPAQWRRARIAPYLYPPLPARHISPMAILKIARMGHPVLGRPAGAVADPAAPEILQLVGDMIDTLADADGAGLAAPQVHVPLRVVMFRVSDDRAADEEDANREDANQGDPDTQDAESEERVPLTVLINPVIEPLSDDVALGWEACLSLPGMTGEVPRHTHIRYRGVGPDGAPIEREASGFHARVVQHECDHLDGILYPMRMTDLSRFGYVEEMRRLAASTPDDAEAEEREEATVDAPVEAAEA